MSAAGSIITLTAAISADGDGYVARCLEVEVTSQGRTVEDALAMLREALEFYFEDAPIPAVTGHPLLTQVDVTVPS